MNKYRNIKTTVNGLVFDSRKEASRYQELRLLQQAGQIHDLRLQVPYAIVINDVKVCKYVADFVYIENGKQRVEDTKGILTPVYRLKKKLMRAVHGIEVIEV